MYTYFASLVSVHDGDTLTLDIDVGFDLTHKARKIRIYGYDAPELARVDGLGINAKSFVQGWFREIIDHYGNQFIANTYKDDDDKYGRILIRQLYDLKGNDLVKACVEAGHLRPYTGRGPKPWAENVTA